MSNLSILGKSQKKKVQPKRRGNYQGGQHIDLKRVLKSKTINKMKKEEYTDLLCAAMPLFEKELKRFYDGNSKVIRDKQTLTELFTNKKFGKALCVAMEQQETMPKIVFFTIADLWISGVKAFNSESNEKLVRKYLKTFKEFNSKDLSKLAKILKIDKNVALSLLLTAVTVKGAKFRLMKNRYRAFLDTLYKIEGLSEKKAAKAMKFCFPSNLYQLLSYALSDAPKNTTENFNIVTNAVLSIIEDLGKEERKNVLKAYANNRKKMQSNGGNRRTRINLLSISEEEYKGITKTVSKLIDTGMDKELFL